MKYFITGATGFIGGRLARLLIERGHEVVALVRNPDKANDLSAAGVTLAKGDITDKASMRDSMTGVDGLFHVAAWYKVGEKNPQAYEINVNGTRNVLELMAELNIPRGVYTSTLGIFSDTKGQIPDESYRPPANMPFLSEYERTKHLAHYEVALPMIENGLPLMIAMPGNVYCPGDASDFSETIRAWLQGKFPAVPGGFAMSFAHVDDICEAHILMMEKGKLGETYIIGGPLHTLTDYFQIAEQITGIRAPRITLSPAMVKMGAGMVGLLERVVKLPPAYSAEGMYTTAGTTYFGDNSKAKRELGYRPRALEEGLRETLAYEMDKLGIRAKV